MSVPIFAPSMRVPLTDPTASYVRQQCEKHNVQSAYLAVPDGIKYRFLKIEMDHLRQTLSECSDICHSWEFEILLLPDNATLYITVPEGA